MRKHMLIASIVALSGCLTTPQISEPAGPGAPATTGGKITATETPRHTQQGAENGVEDQSKLRSAGAEHAAGQTSDADTAKINAWIDEACPRLVGPASWSRCVERERKAVNAGLPSTEGLPADIRAWIDEACPRLVGPASWSRCVKRERRAVNAGLPSTEGLPAEIRAWIDEACPRLVGPASWSRCIRRELNAVSAGLPSGGSSREGAHATPTNNAGESTIERSATPAPTQAESGETNERVAEVPPKRPKDPAPQLPKPENGERWLCGDIWKTLLSTLPEPTIVLTRESPRDQASGTGRIAVGGVIHETHFEIQGISRRWDWNFDDEENAALDTFVIKSDGSGAYYDFRGITGSTRPSEILQCVQG